MLVRARCYAYTSNREQSMVLLRYPNLPKQPYRNIGTVRVSIISINHIYSTSSATMSLENGVIFFQAPARVACQSLLPVSGIENLKPISRQNRPVMCFPVHAYCQLLASLISRSYESSRSGEAPKRPPNTEFLGGKRN